MNRPSSTISLEDRFQIDELVSRYNWAVDTGDADGFVAAFAADGVCVTSKRDYRGHQELRQLMSDIDARRRANDFPHMHIHSSPVLVPGDDGIVRYYAQLIAPRIEPDGSCTFQLGWYDDQLVNVDSVGWRFKRRHFRPWLSSALTRVPFRLPDAD